MDEFFTPEVAAGLEKLAALKETDAALYWEVLHRGEEIFVPETSDQIQQEFNVKFGRIGDRLEDVKSEARSAMLSGEPPTADAIMDVIDPAYDQADREYQEIVKERNERLAERAAELRGELYRMPPGSSSVLGQANAADAEELRTLGELAAKAGDEILGQAVFIVASERGMADLGVAYLNSHPAALTAFRELGSMPTAEELEQGLDFQFPRPSLADLRPQAHESLEADRIARLRRAQTAAWANGW